MSRLYMSIMSRLTKDRQLAGEKARVICYDLDTKKSFSRYFDINSFPELSRSVGCRGICYYDGFIWLATSERGLIKLSPDDLSMHENNFMDTDVIQHTHQIKLHDGKLWMCDTGHDRVAVYNWETKEVESYIDLSCDSDMLDELDNNQKHKPYGTDRLHFNSIEWAPNGDQWHLYMHCNCLFNFTTKRIIAPPQEHRAGMHDILFLDDDRLIYSSSNSNTTYELNLKTEEYRAIYQEPKRARQDNISNQFGWARGLEIDRENGILYATYTPCVLQAYDVNDDYKLLFREELDSDVMESTYDMVLVK